MLMLLVRYNRVSAAVADKAKSQYFILKIKTNKLKGNKSSFARFNKSKQQSDTFLWQYVGSDEIHKPLWHGCQIVFVLEQ